LVELIEQISESFLKPLVILLGEGFLVDALEDLLLLMHESSQPLIFLDLGTRSVVVLLRVDSAEDVFEDGLGLLYRADSTNSSYAGRGSLFLFIILG
jgi:hypothetical protein